MYLFDNNLYTKSQNIPHYSRYRVFCYVISCLYLLFPCLIVRGNNEFLQGWLRGVVIQFTFVNILEIHCWVPMLLSLYIFFVQAMATCCLDYIGKLSTNKHRIYESTAHCDERGDRKTRAVCQTHYSTDLMFVQILFCSVFRMYCFAVIF